jgi:hypothetical protein
MKCKNYQAPRYAHLFIHPPHQIATYSFEMSVLIAVSVACGAAQNFNRFGSVQLHKV